MTIRKALVIAILSLSSAGVAAFSLCQEKLYLSAQGDVDTYSVGNWSYQDPPDAVVLAGGTVPVMDCVSDKSDILIAVEMSGHRYFVGPGKYELLRRRASVAEAWTDRYAIFSCTGLFPQISRQAPNNSFKPKPLRGSA